MGRKTRGLKKLTFAEFSVNKPQDPLYLQLLRHLSGVSQSYALNIGPHNP